MGVSGLYPALKRRYRNINLLKARLPANVSSLAIDMNSLIHPVLQLVYGYGEGKDMSRLVRQKKIGNRILYEIYSQDQRGNIRIKSTVTREQLFQEFISVFLIRLRDIIAAVNPRDMLIMAVDGVPPEAKIAQQRQRRYISATAVKEETSFDGNAVSPGTEFMIKLDEEIIKWIQTMINVQNIQMPPKVIYSSHLVPGEGEHKILDIYRNPENLQLRDPKNPENVTPMKGFHTIFGNDNDLILLSLLLPVNKLYNVRPQHGKLEFDFLDIITLRRAVREDLAHGKYHHNNAIHDFVAMMSLLGNDFLPNPFAFRDMEQAIDVIIAAYHEIKRPVTRRSRTEEEGIYIREYEWHGLTDLFYKLSRKEGYLITGLANQSFLKKLKGGNGATIDLGSYILEQSSAQGTTKTGRLMQKVNTRTFRSLWYNHALEAACPKSAFQTAAKVQDCHDNLTVNSDQIVEMTKSYLTTMAWVYRYYQGGTEMINSEWVYRYFHTPLLIDLAHISGQLRDEDIGRITPLPSDRWITPIHLLLAIIPITSMALLPAEVWKLVQPKSPIYYQFPQSFAVESEGIFREHEARAILPFANMRDIIAATAKIKTLTYGEELVNTRERRPMNTVIERSLDIQEIRAHMNADIEIIKREAVRLRQTKEELGLLKPRKPRQAGQRQGSRGGQQVERGQAKQGPEQRKVSRQSSRQSSRGGQVERGQGVSRQAKRGGGGGQKIYSRNRNNRPAVNRRQKQIIDPIQEEARKFNIRKPEVVKFVKIDNIKNNADFSQKLVF